MGAVGGGLGAAGSRVLGCAANKALKALGGAATDAAVAMGEQATENVLNGRPAGEGLLDAGLGAAVPGTGLVTSVMQNETCFLAGTSVTLGTGGHQAIETLVIGQRVLTPESAQSGPLSPLSGSETAVDPTTWRSYTVRLRDARTGWDIFDITLLRPAGWMAEHIRPLGGGREVWVDFEELNAKGWAEVIEERPCPKIAPGPGRVVTATITHANDDVRTLTMSSGEVLHVTGNHRMFSATRQDWVPVKDLHIGEALRTTKGRESVAALGYQRGRHQVYNIEVETEHCYFVGAGEVLTHNTCGPDGQSLALTHSAKNSVPDEAYDRQSHYGGAQTTSQAGQAARAAAEGKPCPNCGETMSSSDPKRKPIPEHSPPLSDHYNERGGHSMSNEQRRAYAKSGAAINGAACATCHKQQGAAQSKKVKAFNKANGLKKRGL